LHVRKDGRGLRRVTRPDGRHSHWDAAVSPDGRRVAFTDEAGCESGASSFALRVVDASGRRTSDLARLPGNAYSYSDADHEDPTWSPDGSRIAFYRSNQRNPGVHIANQDGSGMRRVTPQLMDAASPAWSPDDAWIAFVGRGDIYVIRPDGTGLRQLTQTNGLERSPAWLPQMPSG